MPFGLAHSDLHVAQICGEEYPFSSNVHIAETELILLVIVSSNLISQVDSSCLVNIQMVL